MNFPAEYTPKQGQYTVEERDAFFGKIENVDMPGNLASYDYANGKPNLTSGTTPLRDGTASVGSSAEAARADHVHPTDSSRAPTNHASTATTYGKGTSTSYGHLMLSGSTSSTLGTSDGTAATPSAVKAAYDLANSKPNLTSSTTPLRDGTASVGGSTEAARADHVHPTDSSRAPTNHASTATTYGKGTSTSYGHLMLSGSTSSTLGTSDGTAATPSAVKAAYDLAAIGGLYDGKKIHVKSVQITLPTSGAANGVFESEQMGTLLSTALIVAVSPNTDTIQGYGIITALGVPIVAQGFVQNGQGYYYVAVQSGTIPSGTTGLFVARYTLASGN